MKNRISKLMDYAYGKDFPKHPMKCFLSSIIWNYCIAAVFIFVIAGIPRLLTNGVLYAFLIFCGPQVVYPFVLLIMRGHEDSYKYSYGFYYGTLGLSAIFKRMNFINGNDMVIFVSAIICASVCVAIYYKRKEK